MSLCFFRQGYISNGGESSPQKFWRGVGHKGGIWQIFFFFGGGGARLKEVRSGFHGGADTLEVNMANIIVGKKPKNLPRMTLALWSLYKGVS